MRILGIDPGYAIIGYGVLDYVGGRFHCAGYGAITTDADTPFSKRLVEIDDSLEKLLTAAGPDAVSLEKLYFVKNVTTGIAVAEARGLILMRAERHSVPVYEYTPMQVKQAVVGYGKAEKHQVMEMTRIMLGLDEIPKPDDAADALAMAICHGYSSESHLRGLDGKGI
ncbi:MAG: crossover junction endodeoxyribonuclease RuvC [Oscillospiraceae bacterium]